MIPFILTIVGGYLIGDSMKESGDDRKSYDGGWNKKADGGMMADGGKVALWKVGSGTAEKLKEGTSASIKSFVTKNKYKGLNWDNWRQAYGLQEWPADASMDQVLKYNRTSEISATSQEYADGGGVPYVLWVSKDGQKRELYGNYKSKRAAEMAMKKLWDKSDYKEMGNGPKSEYDKHGLWFAEGGSIAESNNEMLKSKIKEVKHHADELGRVVKPKTKIEAWVVSKAERSASDLSDITHYLDGKK